MSSAQEIHDACCQRALESFVHTYGFASHAVESYEHFLHLQLPEVIQEQFPMNVPVPKQQVLHRLFLDNICFKKPSMFESSGFIHDLSPTEAIFHKQSYFFDVYVDITQKLYKGPPEKMKLAQHRVYKNMLFFKVPCMVNSSACHNSHNVDKTSNDSGLLIINGYEKVMITQEKLRCNVPYIFTAKGKYTHRCEIRSNHLNLPTSSSYNIHLSCSKAFLNAHALLIINMHKHKLRVFFCASFS
jgi:DNA-directed RNA polymerase beta subunit